MKVWILLLALLIANQALPFDYNGLLQRLASINKNWISGTNKYFDGMSEDMIKRLMGTLPTPQS